MRKMEGRRRMLALVALNALVYGTLAGTTPLRADSDESGEINWIQECACVRVDPQTGKCADWEPSGCPWAKIQSCGAGCP